MRAAEDAIQGGTELDYVEAAVAVYVGSREGSAEVNSPAERVSV